MNYQVIQERLLSNNKLNIYRDFKKMVDRYQLITKGDVIAVEISADKNCFVLMSCLNEYCKEMNQMFELKYFHVQNKEEVSENEKQIIETFEIKEYTVLEEEKADEVYERMKELGCTKVALPNNYNDILNSTFMTFIQRKEAAQIQPKRTSTRVNELNFIRPLCIIEDSKIKKAMEEIGVPIVEEFSLLSKLAYIEENVVMPEKTKTARYEFNIYERI